MTMPGAGKRLDILPSSILLPRPGVVDLVMRLLGLKDAPSSG
jgi:hypothetical protein